jgi:hypothetical protein
MDSTSLLIGTKAKPHLPINAVKRLQFRTSTESFICETTRQYIVCRLPNNEAPWQKYFARCRRIEDGLEGMVHHFGKGLSDRGDGGDELLPGGDIVEAALAKAAEL